MEDDQRPQHDISTLSKSILLMGGIAIVYAVLAKLFLTFATANGNVSSSTAQRNRTGSTAIIRPQIWPAIFIALCWSRYG